MGFDNVNVNVSGPKQPTSTYKTKVLKGNHSFASQVTEPNMKYVIKHDFDLGGGSVTIPEGCVLEFDGGSISGGTLTGNHTIIDSNTLCIKRDTIIKGTWDNTIVYTRWFEFISSDDGITDNVLQFKQLQAVINGTNGCKVEFEQGYYQSQIMRMDSGERVTIDGVNYVLWTNDYSESEHDGECILNVRDIPYVDINLNGSTIQKINVTNPRSNTIQFLNVDNACIHDGTLIGMAINNFSYPLWANIRWVTDHYEYYTSNDYEFEYGIFQIGGFLTVDNMNVQYQNGDGIVAGSYYWYSQDSIVRYASKGYVISNSEISYCARNGLCLHSSDEAQIINCHIHHIGSDSGSGVIGGDGIMGRNPRVGIDVEFEDGMELKPVMKWDSLYIHDCGGKSFSFASAARCRVRQFYAVNCCFMSLGQPNNMNADGPMEYENCHFEYDGKGYLVGENVVYNNCEFILKAPNLLLGNSVFRGCIITDAIQGELTSTNYVFAQNLCNCLFDKCTITIKHIYGFLHNGTFRDCVLNFYSNTILRAIGSEYYNCTFNNDPEDDSGRSFQFGAGNLSEDSKGYIKIVGCTFNNAVGYGTGNDAKFFNTGPYPVTIENSKFNALNITHGSNYLQKIKIVKSDISTFGIVGYSQTTAGVESVVIDRCNIDDFKTLRNGMIIKIINSRIGITEKVSGYGLQMILFINSILDYNINITSSAYKDTDIKGINSIFNFIQSTKTEGYTLEDCYIMGVITEALYNGSKNGCVFETPIP